MADHSPIRILNECRNGGVLVGQLVRLLFRKPFIFNLYWEVITREPSKRNPKSALGPDNPADQERKFDYSWKPTMDALCDHLGHI